jgi:hypothetical protein
MIALDTHGTAFTTQDANPHICVINQNGDKLQYEIDFSHFNIDTKAHFTGPGVAVAPDGSIWCVLLGAECGLLRIKAFRDSSLISLKTPEITYYNVGKDALGQNKSVRLIHLVFDKLEFCDVGEKNASCTISSDLLDAAAVNALIVFRFADDDCDVIEGYCIVPLLTQQSKCHRVAVINRRAIVVTELASSKIFRIDVKQLPAFSSLVESRVSKHPSCIMNFINWFNCSKVAGAEVVRYFNYNL